MSNQFFTGQWQSQFHPLKIQFNENVWQLVASGHDNSSGALFGLFSENDGASFSLDYALIDDQQKFDYEYAESEYFSRLFNLDNQCKKTEQFQIEINQLAFKCCVYQFHNQRYGEQTVIRAMHISPTKVIGIGMAWPINEQGENKIHPKFQLLLDNLIL